MPARSSPACAAADFEARHVVVGEVDGVRAVFSGHAIRVRRAPRHRAVIGAGREQDLALARSSARERHAGRRRIGAVLGKQRPVRMGDEADQPLGQFDQPRGRAIQAVALGKLPPHGFVHGGVTMAQHDRPPAAHEVEIFPAVRIPDVTALAAFKELRVAGRQGRGSHVTVHAAGNDFRRALAQQVIRMCNQTVRHDRISRQPAGDSVCRAAAVASIFVQS